MNNCTGARYPNEFYNLSSIENWHGKFGHLNVLKLDHDSECTGFGKHNRIVNYGDFTGRIDKVWQLRNPTEKEIVRYYKKEWSRKGNYKAVIHSEDEQSIYFEIIKV